MNNTAFRLPVRRSFVRSFLGDERGVGYLELGLVLPVLLLLLVGTIDLSQFISAKLDLEQAAQRTTDLALADRPRSSDGSYLATEAANAAGVSAESVTVSIYLECGDVREVDFDTVCPGGQSHARYVSVTIQDQLDPLLGWSSFAQAFGFGSVSGSISVTGSSVVRFQ